jgi:hypothetical protein
VSAFQHSLTYQQLSGLLAEKERPAVIEFKGNGDSDSSELERLRRRKAERLSHPPSAKALTKALSAVQSRPSNPAEQTSAARDLECLPRKSHALCEGSRDLGVSSPRSPADDRRAVARSSSGNLSFDDSVNFTGGADLEQVKLMKKYRRLEDSGAVLASSPTLPVSSSKSKRADGGSGKTSGDRGEERASEQFATGKAQNGSGDGYNGKGSSSAETTSSTDRRGPLERTAPAAAAPRHKPAGHGIDAMNTGVNRISAPAQACTQRFVGRVTAESRGSLFMESSVGTTDIFIPAPLCKSRTSPVQVGDTLAVEAYENMVNGNRWKVLRILTPDGMTEDAGKGRRSGGGDSGGPVVKESIVVGKESGQLIRNLKVEVRNCDTSPWTGQLSADRYGEGGGVGPAGRGGRGLLRPRQDGDKSARDEAMDNRDRVNSGGRGISSAARSSSWEEGPIGTNPPASDTGGRRVLCKNNSGPPAAGAGKW